MLESQKFIDVHHHIVPPAYLNRVKERLLPQGLLPPPVLDWNAEQAVAALDRNEVETAVVSIFPPGVWLGDSKEAADFSRIFNEYASELVEAHPRRFGSFAALPLPDVEASLRELEYAMEVLKADGIGLMTSYGSKWLGDPVFQPVFEELDRRAAVVYVHPTVPVCCQNLIPWLAAPMLEFPFDTTRAIASLLYSGTFSRFHNIRWIFSHAGGALPMLAGRIDKLGAGLRKELAERVPNGVTNELRKLFYEIAGSANRPAFAALQSLVADSQILFGSDYPFVPIAATATGLGALGLSFPAIQAIRRDNALELLPHLRNRLQKEF